MNYNVTTVVGLQYGDEGKGKIVQGLASYGGYDVSARFNGGPNAGHTLHLDEGKKLVTHVVPSGIVCGVPVNFIGAGCAADPVLLRAEVEEIISFGFDPKKIFISELVHLITPYDRKIDAVMNGKIGTTGKGIGPTYAHKAHRIGIRFDTFVEGGRKTLFDYYTELRRVYRQDWIVVSQTDFDEWLEALTWLRKNINVADRNFFLSGGYMRNHITTKRNIRILAEGAQAVMLDNTHGTYPFVTSSNCLPSAVYSGLGIPGTATIEKVIGVFKAYNTRVGDGPFDTQIMNEEEAEKLRMAGNEYGSTTGRPRRVGWINLPELQRAIELSGATHLVMTKADVLSVKAVNTVRVLVKLGHGSHDSEWKDFKPFDTSKVTQSFHINGSFGEFITFLEARLGQHITAASLGPEHENLVYTMQGGSLH